MVTRTQQRYAEILDDLAQRWPESAIDPSLARIRALVDLLGDPQASYPVIHVAGTNGKTSTARMIESMLRAFGLRTGLYTSPHLSDIRERILIDGEPIDEETFVRVVDDIAPYAGLVDHNSQAEGGPRLSFFELMTGIAFAAFADAPVDVAVIEVGLGGTWDATNVADAVVAVITAVDLDHTELLGDTPAQIATEKSGIVKPEAMVVSSPQSPDVVEVIGERCTEVGAALALAGAQFALVRREVAVGGQSIAVQGLAGVYEDLFLPLFGEHQAVNAATAVAAVEGFFGAGRDQLDIDAVRDGLAAATSPGRLEVMRRSPAILIDAAHNPHGARATAAALAESFDFERIVGVLAVLRGKDVHGLLTALEPVLDEVVVTQNSSARCLPADELAEQAMAVFGELRVTVVPGLADAIDQAASLAEEVGLYSAAGVLVTGSVVTAGDARRLLHRRSG